jgi:acyl dehydratase
LPVLDRPDDSAEPAWIDTVDVPPQAPYLYDGCTDIVFAIHTSPAFAAMVGLPGILLQGTAALAMAAGRVLDHETDGDPARLGQIAVRFGGMLLPGRPLQVVAGGRRRDDGTIAVGFEVRDDTGRPALRDGLAVLSTP